MRQAAPEARDPDGIERAGRLMRISVPCPRASMLLNTVMVPPRPSMMFLAIGRPRPVPPRLVVKYGSKTRDRLAPSMPVPLSKIVIETPPVMAVVVTETDGAAGVRSAGGAAIRAERPPGTAPSA